MSPESSLDKLFGGLWFLAYSSLTWILPIACIMCAFMLMLFIGNPMIAWLKNKRWKKGTTLDETWTVREDTPDTHQAKQGTPSMGGPEASLST